MGTTELESDESQEEPKKRPTASIQVNRLVRLIETLRGANGCPWDKKQTPASISVYLIEEVYELVEAIASDNPESICEELGDVLFHLLFIARLFQEKQAFGLNQAIDGIVDKMIRRHPHVFGDSPAESIAEIRDQWRSIKKEEKKNALPKSILDSVPAGLPALLRAYRISERAAGAGFDWDDIHGVMEKVEEEWREFKEAVATDDDRREIEMEFGDLLFTMMNVARIARIHPESALQAATHKFETRYRFMEKQLENCGESTDSVPRDELERLWEMAKITYKNNYI